MRNSRPGSSTLFKAMIICLFAVSSALAQDSLKVEKVEAEAGGNAVLKVLLSSGQPISGAQFDILYDTAGLQLLGLEEGQDAGSFLLNPVDIATANDSGKVTVTLADSSNSSLLAAGSDQELLLLTFAVDSSATGELPVELADVFLADSSGDTLASFVLAGGVILTAGDSSVSDDSTGEVTDTTGEVTDTTGQDDGDNGDYDEIPLNTLFVGDIEASAGRDINVRVHAKSLEGVYGAAFHLLFDPAVLQVKEFQASKQIDDGYTLDDSVDLVQTNADGMLELKFTTDSTAEDPMFHGNAKQLVIVTFTIDQNAVPGSETEIDFSDLLFTGGAGDTIEMDHQPGTILIASDEEESQDSLTADNENSDSLDVENSDSLNAGGELSDSTDAEGSDSLNTGGENSDSLNADSLNTENSDSLNTGGENSDSLDAEVSDSTSSDSLAGDFDGNGKLGVPDLLYMLRAMVSHQEQNTEQFDLNQDGKTDVFDLLELLSQLSGQKNGIHKRLDPGGNGESHNNSNGKGVFSGGSGPGLASATDASLQLLFPDGSILSLPWDYDGTGLENVSSTGKLAGEVLHQAGSMLSAITMQQVSLPKAFTLAQNYPNPFNPSTTIQFEIPDGSSVRARLTVHNLRGQVVKVLVDGVKSPGSYQVQWDGRDESGREVPSGIYFYRLQAAGYTETRKMVLVK